MKAPRAHGAYTAPHSRCRRDTSVKVRVRALREGAFPLRCRDGAVKRWRTGALTVRRLTAPCLGGVTAPFAETRRDGSIRAYCEVLEQGVSHSYIGQSDSENGFRTLFNNLLTRQRFSGQL